MKWLVRLTIIAAIIIAGLYFIGKSMASGLITSQVSGGYFSDVTYDVTIGEILDAVCDDGEWIHDIPDEEDYYSIANIVRYRGSLDGQPVELMFLGLSGNPRLDYFRLGDTVIQRSDDTFLPHSQRGNEIDNIPFYLYQMYIEKKK